jgi:hypothetical protein
MFQQMDCDVSYANATNPSGCLNDLFPWIEEKGAATLATHGPLHLPAASLAFEGREWLISVAQSVLPIGGGS